MHGGNPLIKIVNSVSNKIHISRIIFYYFLYYFPLRYKIRKILSFDKHSTSLFDKDQEEQSLPNIKKHKKKHYYIYMLGRYLYSIKYIKNKKVLDSGCGLGWGSYLISDFPKELFSIDINAKALKFAKEKWNSPKLNFLKHSVLDLINLKNKFKVVLSYELIEHLTYEDGKKYLNQVYKILEKEGVLIMSSSFPSDNKKARELKKKNSFHLHIYTKSEIKNILNDIGFSKINFLGNFMLIAKK